MRHFLRLKLFLINHDNQEQSPGVKWPGQASRLSASCRVLCKLLLILVPWFPPLYTRYKHCTELCRGSSVRKLKTCEHTPHQNRVSESQLLYVFGSQLFQRPFFSMHLSFLCYHNCICSCFILGWNFSCSPSGLLLQSHVMPLFFFDIRIICLAPASVFSALVSRLTCLSPHPRSSQHCPP